MYLLKTIKSYGILFNLMLKIHNDIINDAYVVYSINEIIVNSKVSLYFHILLYNSFQNNAIFEHLQPMTLTNISITQGYYVRHFWGQN